ALVNAGQRRLGRFDGKLGGRIHGACSNVGGTRRVPTAGRAGRAGNMPAHGVCRLHCGYGGLCGMGR
ncbi:MAG: hypothetical protein ABSG53_29745, partial [Thermoguttaceae bacterium]